MKIGAIFSDYDGTLAPEDVAFEASRLPKEIEEPLRLLSALVPVAIVTSKDIGFVRPRTRFARAWACVSGLEIVLDNGRASAAEGAEDRLREALRYVKRRDKYGLALELKRSSTKELLGFSVDWRARPPPPDEFIEVAASDIVGMGLTVIHDSTKPFVDVFASKPDKGRAVRELKRLLGVKGKVLFIGDSAADNPAFEEADLALCVTHGQSLEGVACRFAIRQEELGALLRSLAHDRLYLDPRSLARGRRGPGIRGALR